MRVLRSVPKDQPRDRTQQELLLRVPHAHMQSPMATAIFTATLVGTFSVLWIVGRSGLSSRLKLRSPIQDAAFFARRLFALARFSLASSFSKSRRLGLLGLFQ